MMSRITEEQRELDRFVIAHSNPNGDLKIILNERIHMDDIGILKANEEEHKEKLYELRDLLKTADEWRMMPYLQSTYLQARYEYHELSYDCENNYWYIRDLDNKNYEQREKEGRGIDALKEALYDLWII